MQRVSRYEDFNTPGRAHERGRPVVRTAKTIMEEGPFAEEEYDDSVSSDELDERMAAMQEGLRAAQDGAKGAQYGRDWHDVFRKKCAAVQAELSEWR